MRIETACHAHTLCSIVRSVDVLAQDVSSLKDRMAAVRKDIEHVESVSAHAHARDRRTRRTR